MQVAFILRGGLLDSAGCTVQVGGVGAAVQHRADGLCDNAVDQAGQVGFGELLLLLLFRLLLAQCLFDGCINGVLDKIERLPAGTPVMIDMKGPYGSFFYPSHLDGAVHSASTDVDAVAALVDTLMNKKFYTIARVCSLRDWNFGNEHVTCGLYMLSRAGLWLDQGYFWLDPTNATTISWITSVVLELKEMGFNEVMLADFRFPNSDQYIFNGDKEAALQDAASKLMGTCGGDNFTLSFGVADPAFKLPEGRCRLYLEDVDAANVEAKATLVDVPDIKAQLVFMAATNDTRFDSYSVIRSLNAAEILEAQKAEAAS